MIFASYDSEYLEIQNFMNNEWGMEEHYVKSFLDICKRSVCKIYSKGKGKVRRGLLSENSHERSMAQQAESEIIQFTLIQQAYLLYMKELRSGNYVGSDAELTIWAILIKRLDLVAAIDKAFANFLESKHLIKFPNLFDLVFKTEFGSSQEESLYDYDSLQTTSHITDCNPKESRCAPLLPSMPAVFTGNPASGFNVGRDQAFFFKDIPTNHESETGEKSYISYIYTLVLICSESNLPIHYITLEKGAPTNPFLCAFNENGDHLNYGSNDLWLNEHTFLEEAFDLLTKISKEYTVRSEIQ